MYDRDLPLVSLLIVGRNAAAFVDDALSSARAQTYPRLDILFVDDASTDDTRERVLRHVAEDPRLRLVKGPGVGLSAVRNMSLEAATGEFVAILDSDDILHPEHLERLVAAALESGAEIVAGNMLSFHSDHGPVHPPPSLLLTSSSWAEEKIIRPAEFIRANSFNTASPPLGYLKPLFRRAFLTEFSLTYDTRLRIGEDYDLVARCLEAGARYLFLPAPTYFYRRHDTSTSFRLSIPDLESLVATCQEAISRDPDSDYGKALLERHDSLLVALAHQRTVELFKGGQPIRALRLACSSGRALRLLAASGIEGSTRRLRRLLRAPRRSSTAAAVPTALSLGVLRAGSPTGRLERKLQTAGFDVIRQAQLEPVAVASSAISLPRLDLILAPSPEAAEAAAYTLSPQVPVLTEASNQARRYGYDMLVEPAGAGSTSIIPSNSNARRKACIPHVGMDLADPEE